jgi:alkylated DNA repair protein (DNA oxidative demethylase)
MTERLEGLRLRRGWLNLPTQEALLSALTVLLEEAPPFRPIMPQSGRPFSVRMSNAGPLGWVSDRDGYRYQRHHPETERPWPAMPECVLEIWRALADYPAPPEACLINLYDASARMGLHQDRDEAAMDAPVVSISLGSAARFRAGRTRAGPAQSFTLESGDVLVLGGPSRLAFHGIDRVFSGTSPLPPLPTGAERINLTLRRVTLSATPIS